MCVEFSYLLVGPCGGWSLWLISAMLKTHNAMVLTTILDQSVGTALSSMHVRDKSPDMFEELCISNGTTDVLRSVDETFEEHLEMRIHAHVNRAPAGFWTELEERCAVEHTQIGQLHREVVH
jgi:hypothetical protein